MLMHETRPLYYIYGNQPVCGYEAIVDSIQAKGGLWLFDGAYAVDWKIFHSGLRDAFAKSPRWKPQVDSIYDIHDWQINPEAARKLLEPYLETGDRTYGRFYEGGLSDFFHPSALEKLAESIKVHLEYGQIVVVYGTGSSLLPLSGHTAWVDLPYESIRVMAEKGSVYSLGDHAKLSEKILTNVDYPVLDRQRASLLPSLDLYIDFRDAWQPISLDGSDLRAGLHSMAKAPFRVVPAIYTSMWGGHYLVNQVAEMRDFPRCSHYYALFPPVNSLLLEGDGLQVELPFELLMHLEGRQVQGERLFQVFGARMPVRFTLMDTIGGMNLSHQIHPNRRQAKAIFNTDFDEPETYFVLETGEGARLNLGLRDDIDVQDFRQAVARAQDEQVGFELTDFVNSFESRPGMVVHVPSSMVHNAGAENLILEVTTHPVGHTYRIYDYMRRTSDGGLRPLHVTQAFACLDEKRTLSWIREKGLFPQPQLVAEGEGWQVRRLSCPPLTAYVNDEIIFRKEFAASTGGERFHLLLAVEGDSIRVEGQGFSHPLHQYELLIVPAAAGEYRLVNGDPTGRKCRVFQVYVTSPEEYFSAEL